MDQFIGVLHNRVQGTSAWDFAHDRLSQMLLDRVDPLRALAVMVKRNGASRSLPSPSVSSATRGRRGLERL